MYVYINSPKFKILNLPLTFHLQYPPDSRDNDLYWLGRYALPSHDSMLGKKDTILLLCIFKIYLRFYFTFYCCSIIVVPFSPLCPLPAPFVHPVVHAHGSFLQVPSLHPSLSFPTYPLPLPGAFMSFKICIGSCVIF